MKKVIRPIFKPTKLDVGCGNNPAGDVNCDLFIGKTPHIEDRDNIIDPKTIPNFIRCDAHHLPFKDSCFEEVFSSHILEHVDDATKVMLEMVRVTNNKILFKIPHRFARRPWYKLIFKMGRWPVTRHHQSSSHKRFFNVKSVEKWLRKLNLNPRLHVNYHHLPPFLPILWLPWEIEGEMRVRK